MAAKIKTTATAVSVDKFIDKVPSEQKRDDCRAIARIMEEVTGEPATMWGPSIIGFGSYSYTYESGHSGVMCRVGFAPRGSNFALYLGVEDDDAELRKLGKYKKTKGCVYINKLDDVDVPILKKLIKKSFNLTR